MEPKFKNTFIPKNPIVNSHNRRYSRRKTSFIGILIAVIFIITSVTAAGVFAYTYSLNKSILEKDNTLKTEINTLNPELIKNLSHTDTQLKLTNNLLRRHLLTTPFFTYLESITLQKVQFTDFIYTAKPGTNPTVVFTGIAPNYEVVALQSDVFSRDKNVLNSSFSDLNLTEEGQVSFSINITISDSLTSYKQQS